MHEVKMSNPNKSSIYVSEYFSEFILSTGKADRSFSQAPNQTLQLELPVVIVM